MVLKAGIPEVQPYGNNNTSLDVPQRFAQPALHAGEAG